MEEIGVLVPINEPIGLTLLLPSIFLISINWKNIFFYMQSVQISSLTDVTSLNFPINDGQFLLKFKLRRFVVSKSVLVPFLNSRLQPLEFHNETVAQPTNERAISPPIFNKGKEARMGEPHIFESEWGRSPFFIAKSQEKMIVV